MGPADRAVVVTGASTGIGFACAVRLAEHGFRVFGTVRRDADAAPLARHRVTPVYLDVTDSASIAAARAQVTDALADTPLAGLVNNAGIPSAFPMEHVPLDDLRRVLEVNVVGVVAVTQAFLPMLRRARGRIVNMSSVAGLIPLPFMGPYSASKFALESISDVFRRELMPAGVDVIVVEPGSVRSAIWGKVARIDTSPLAGTEYGPVAARIQETSVARGERGLDAHAVADAVLRALTVRRPPTRIVVAKRLWRNRVVRWLPDRLVDRIIARRVWR